MSHSANHGSDAIARFHRIVSEGDLEGLQSALASGIDVNAPGHMGMTALMLALQSKYLEKTKLLLRQGADPELTDDFNATALRHAVYADFADGVAFLLGLNVDRGYNPRYPLKKTRYSSSLGEFSIPAELTEVLPETEWLESLKEYRRQLRKEDENPTVEPIIADVQSVDVLKLFLDTGEDLSGAPTEIKRALVGLHTGGDLRIRLADYRKDKSPRFGCQNPERMDVAFWQDMVRTGGTAYSARSKFADEGYTESGAVWCYDRFGSSLTPLEDGRFVQIAGEHEDYYDRDFYIYNDVVVHDGRGSFQIYGYPREIFPPIDFHSATLCGGDIFIVGCLGYPEQRQLGFTPVFRLVLASWQIQSVETAGAMPSWIHRHRATYIPDRNVIRISGGSVLTPAPDGETQSIPNPDQFELDLARMHWRRMR